jgi:hypothetical protein
MSSVGLLVKDAHDELYAPMAVRIERHWLAIPGSQAAASLWQRARRLQHNFSLRSSGGLCWLSAWAGAHRPARQQRGSRPAKHS